MPRFRSLGSKLIDALLRTDADARSRPRVVTLDCRSWLAHGADFATVVPALEGGLTALDSCGAFIAFFLNTASVSHGQRETLATLVRSCRDQHFITMAHVDIRHRRPSGDALAHLDALPFDLLLIDTVPGIPPPPTGRRRGASGERPGPRWVVTLSIDLCRTGDAADAVEQWSRRADALAFSPASRIEHGGAPPPRQRDVVLERAAQQARRRCLLLTDPDAILTSGHGESGSMCESPLMYRLTPSGTVRCHCPRIDEALRAVGEGGMAATLTGEEIVERFTCDDVRCAVVETQHCPDRSACQQARSPLCGLTVGAQNEVTTRLGRWLRYPAEVLRWLLVWRR